MKELSIPNLRQYHEVLTRSAQRTNEMHLLLNEITVARLASSATSRSCGPAKTGATQHRGQQGEAPYKHLRIWSAGCSTGEEPYTMAMILLEEAQRFLRGFTFEIIATDLNDRSLQRCQEGIYGDYALRNVAPETLRRYFDPVAGTRDYRVRDEVRKLIKFSRVNLLMTRACCSSSR